MATFDRFDICEAYLLLETLWNEGGHIPERTRRQHGKRAESIGVQLSRMHFKPRVFLDSPADLTDNGREIYNLACERLHLGDSGYKECVCRDCFELAIGWGAPMCNVCAEAGCDPSRECRAPGAHGVEEPPDPEDDV